MEARSPKSEWRDEVAILLQLEANAPLSAEAPAPKQVCNRFREPRVVKSVGRPSPRHVGAVAQIVAVARGRKLVRGSGSRRRSGRCADPAASQWCPLALTRSR